MRILVALAPKMYRQTFAYILRRDRPNDEVRLACPQALDLEASSFRPHMIVSSDNAAQLRENVSVPSWVVIRYNDHLGACIFLKGQDTRLIQDMTIDNLREVVEETQRLLVRDS